MKTMCNKQPPWQLLDAVEEQARRHGCRWANLRTWEFRARDFPARCEYPANGLEVHLLEGHLGHLMRKDL
jgi:GNAT superfamily N-acetyltransferase